MSGTESSILRTFFSNFIPTVPFWTIFTFQCSAHRWALAGRLMIPRAYFRFCLQLLQLLHAPLVVVFLCRHVHIAPEPDYLVFLEVLMLHPAVGFLIWTAYCSHVVFKCPSDAPMQDSQHGYLYARAFDSRASQLLSWFPHLLQYSSSNFNFVILTSPSSPL